MTSDSHIIKSLDKNNVQTIVLNKLLTTRHSWEKRITPLVYITGTGTGLTF